MLQTVYIYITRVVLKTVLVSLKDGRVSKLICSSFSIEIAVACYILVLTDILCYFIFQHREHFSIILISTGL